MPPLPAHGPPPRPCLEAAPLRRREDPGAPTFAERRGVREPTGLPSGLSSTQRGEGGARRHVPATELLMLFGENKHLALPNAWLHLWRQGQAGDQGSKSDRSPARARGAARGPEAERVTGWGPAARQGQGAGPLGERPRGAPTPHWPLAARSGRGRGPRAQGAGGGRAASRAGPGLAEPAPAPGRGGAGSYQRGQLAACPCASAPAQFNGHCPPAPLFRRRPLPAGPGWGERAETPRAEPRPGRRTPQPGVRGHGRPPGAPWAWGRLPEPSREPSWAQLSLPPGLSVPSAEWADGQASDPGRGTPWWVL